MNTTTFPPPTERWHVSTYSGTCCINSEAVVGKTSAEELRGKRINELKRDNANFRADYESQLREAVFDETCDDRIPSLIQFNYRYVVESCDAGNACIACYEAGLILMEGWA